MSQKNIILIIVLSFLAFLFLAGFFIFSNFISNRSEKALMQNQAQPEKNNPNGEKTAVAQKMEIKIDLAKDKNGAALLSAEEKKDAGECLKLSGAAINTCLSLLAASLQNKSFCAQIADKTEMEKCSDMAIFKKALFLGDANVCAEITEESIKKSCVINIVEKNKLAKKDCENLAEKEKTYCLDYLKLMEDNKIFNSAKVAGDCNLIFDATVKLFCLDKFKQ
jgi:hypothetical protein